MQLKLQIYITNFLFFVSDGKGGHRFSRTLKNTGKILTYGKKKKKIKLID